MYTHKLLIKLAYFITFHNNVTARVTERIVTEEKTCLNDPGLKPGTWRAVTAYTEVKAYAFQGVHMHNLIPIERTYNRHELLPSSILY